MVISLAPTTRADVEFLTRDFVGVGGQDAKTRLPGGSVLLGLLDRHVGRFPGEESRHGVVRDAVLCFEDQVDG